MKSRAKFPDEIERVVLRRAGLARLLRQTGQLLLLPDVGRKRDDLGVVRFAKPFDDDVRVEAARISEDDFHSEMSDGFLTANGRELTRMIGKDAPHPFEFGAFEVDDYSDLKPRNFQ